MSFTLSQQFAEAWQMPPDESIYQWAARNVTFGSWSPYEGRFNPELMPWLIRPMEAMRQDDLWRIVIVAAAAGGKSTLAELFLSWLIARAPGPVAWNAPTEEDAKEFSETRIQRFLESCPEVSKWFPQNRHKKRTNAILFPHMSLIIQAANEGNAQMKHLRYLINDETWLWKPGILTQMHKRTTRFAHNRKVIDISTGSLDGDETDQGWKDGTREEWQFRCEACHGHHVPQFTFGRKDAPGGVKWSADARRKDGTWDYRIVIGTTEYECPHCQRRYQPTDANAVMLNRHGCYSTPSADANPGVASFSWSALVSDFRLLPQIAVELLQAKEAIRRGTMELMREVTQKRFAKAWKDEPASDVVGTRESDYNMGDPWPDEVVRIFTVDVQLAHFWGVIRAWSADGRSRLVWAGRIETWDEVRDLQNRNAVRNDFVIVDSGAFSDRVYTACCKWDWTAIKGEEAAGGYLLKVGKGDEERNVRVPVKESNERRHPIRLEFGSIVPSCAYYLVSDSMTSDSMDLFRSGRAEGWTIARDTPEDHRRQIAAPVRRTRPNPKTGQMQTEWITLGRDGEHLWDCERYQLAFAWQAGLIGVSEQAKA